MTSGKLRSIVETIEQWHRSGYLLMVLFFGIGGFLIWWKTNHLEIKYPRTGGSCVDVVERVWKKRPAPPTALEQADLDDCEEGLREAAHPVTGR